MGGRLALVLGDQLTLSNPALARLDRGVDQILMIEAPGEATHVWSHKARITLFLAAMRHFANALVDAGHRLTYVEIDADQPAGMAERLALALKKSNADTLHVCEPGEWRVLTLVQDCCATAGVDVEVLPDPHFLITLDGFRRWAGNSRSLRMEFFYRHMRRTTGILMEAGEPVGGQWNFDAENRAGFGAKGPLDIPRAPHFEPDRITREVIALVEKRFPDHPGELASFGWPVTRDDALRALEAFVQERLGAFGRHQDAMWAGEPFLWHALLSSSLNLKLLDPREVIAATLAAYRARALPLAGVEGFVRQILGWREFIRGVYWHYMPQLAADNHFGHTRPLPKWFWTGDTHLNCLRESIGQTLRHGYAHHIQRLMVTGNFALLAGLRPQAVCDWYLAVHVDAVEWAELPNTAGMALFADGGHFTSKPYVASGAYIRRMSNYCQGCRYDPAVRSGPAACPITLLYWYFIDQHAKTFAANPRTSLMARNLERLPVAELAAIRTGAARVLDNLDAL